MGLMDDAEISPNILFVMGHTDIASKLQMFTLKENFEYITYKPCRIFSVCKFAKEYYFS